MLVFTFQPYFAMLSNIMESSCGATAAVCAFVLTALCYLRDVCVQWLCFCVSAGFSRVR